jgi:hypothetical protein
LSKNLAANPLAQLAAASQPFLVNYSANKTYDISARMATKVHVLAGYIVVKLRNL